jgi:hypothetical protein
MPLLAFMPLTSGEATGYWLGVDTTLPNESRSTKIIRSNTTTMTTGTAYADALRVGWQYSDLSKFPPAYAVSLAKQISVDFTPVASLSTPTASPASSSNLPRETGSPPPGTLSTGAKAGIGVGAVLAFLLLLSLVFATLFIRKRRQKRTITNTDPAAIAETPEMEDQDTDLATRKWYLGGRWRNEAEAKNHPGELDSRAVHVVPGPPAELDAGERRR